MEGPKRYVPPRKDPLVLEPLRPYIISMSVPFTRTPVCWQPAYVESVCTEFAISSLSTTPDQTC